MFVRQVAPPCFHSTTWWASHRLFDTFYSSVPYTLIGGDEPRMFETAAGLKSHDVAANGHLYFCSSKGVVTVAEAGDTLQIKSRNQLDEPIFATPAIADDASWAESSPATPCGVRMNAPAP